MIVWAHRAFLLTLFCLGLQAQAALKAGEDYDVIPAPIAAESKGTIEVVELFWYHCGHCYETQKVLHGWRNSLPKDVVLRPMHVMYPGRSDLEGDARLYLALKALGKLDEYQDKVFAASFEQRLELRDPEVLTNWVKAQGLPVTRFMAAYNGFSMGTQLGELQRICLSNNIGQTPTFIVGGKYRLLPAKNQTMEGMFASLNELIAMARAESGRKK